MRLLRLGRLLSPSLSWMYVNDKPSGRSCRRCFFAIADPLPLNFLNMIDTRSHTFRPFLDFGRHVPCFQTSSRCNLSSCWLSRVLLTPPKTAIQNPRTTCTDSNRGRRPPSSQRRRPLLTATASGRNRGRSLPARFPLLRPRRPRIGPRSSFASFLPGTESPMLACCPPPPRSTWTPLGGALHVGMVLWVGTGHEEAPRISNPLGDDEPDDVVIDRRPIR
jgi:hypothetical protein